MLEQRRLDGCICDALVKYMPVGKSPDSDLDEELLVAAGVAAFNDFFGESSDFVSSRFLSVLLIAGLTMRGPQTIV